MKFNRILIIDNFDSFTFNLVDFLLVAGAEVKVFRNNVSLAQVKAENPDLLVFSPGPSVPANAGNLIPIIKEFKGKIPMFGVCLGLEALIEAFGGNLKFVHPVHGKRSAIAHDGKTIFSGLEPGFSAGRYHSLVADKVPECFAVSATHDDLVMAIRHKTLPIEAVQFHPESVLTMENDNGLKMIKNVVSGSLCNL